MAPAAVVVARPRAPAFPGRRDAEVRELAREHRRPPTVRDRPSTSPRGRRRRGVGAVVGERARRRPREVRRHWEVRQRRRPRPGAHQRYGIGRPRRRRRRAPDGRRRQTCWGRRRRRRPGPRRPAVARRRDVRGRGVRRGLRLYFQGVDRVRRPAGGGRRVAGDAVQRVPGDAEHLFVGVGRRAPALIWGSGSSPLPNTGRTPAWRRPHAGPGTRARRAAAPYVSLIFGGCGSVLWPGFAVWAAGTF